MEHLVGRSDICFFKYYLRPKYLNFTLFPTVGTKSSKRYLGCKWFSWYHLPCRFKIFINVSTFLYVEANSKEICEEISFLSLFLQKNADVSINFLSR